MALTIRVNALAGSGLHIGVMGEEGRGGGVGVGDGDGDGDGGILQQQNKERFIDGLMSEMIKRKRMMGTPSTYSSLQRRMRSSAGRGRGLRVIG